MIPTSSRFRRLILLTALSLWGACGASAQETMQLSGTWRFQLDPMGFGKTPGSELYLSKLNETIHLPGSTDEGGKGIRNTAAHVDRLSRKFEYSGSAWYQREVVIPDSWRGKEIILNLERCHWETEVYVDGNPAGIGERLSTPNRFNLTKYLAPGVHTITICVDNRLKYPMDQWNHGTTEYTQTNWNGIVGRMELEARIPNFIRHVRTSTSGDTVKARVVVNGSEASRDGQLALRITDDEGRTVHTSSLSRSLGGDAVNDTIDITMPLNRKARMWDEFSAPIYSLQVDLATPDGSDTYKTDFGFREVEQGAHHVRLNGRDIHLRGVLDCAVFPLTGYPATDTAAWERIMRTIRSYGMNHIRFHSWCPPQAAFEAADRLGMYLQVELPMWIKDVGSSPARRDFFEEEMYAILDEYGNHPSFILFCNGNENEGDFAVLEDLVKKARAYDDRRLYSASTARTHTASDQFYVSHVTDKGWITVYEGKPSTDWDLSATSDIDVPVIAHETGQRCMYPNFDEIGKYSGVIEPRNFNLFKERLAMNGMLHQADDFFKATGAHTVLQYKEVNEALLRTPLSGGFQLLGLADFPGQGSAYVGLLDAFWEDKGLVTPEKFRESCGPAVLLARFPKRVITGGESLPVKFLLYNYSDHAVKGGTLRWELKGDDGSMVGSGKLPYSAVAQSAVDSLASVVISFDRVEKPGKYTLHATLPDGLHNEWDFWVYPSAPAYTAVEQAGAVTDWTEAKELLRQGRSVLFVPEKTTGRKTRFAGHFWNPIMFNWDPMIVGTLIDNAHLSLAGFPTSYYADWQWTDVLNHARALDLTAMESLTPVVQSIDSYETNRKLGVAFEAQVGDGRLYVLCVDPAADLSSRPATRQLLQSVSRYVASDDFKPAVSLTEYQLDELFDTDHPAQAADSATSTAVKQLLNQ